MARDYIPLQVRFYDDTLLEALKNIARLENRSTNAQILEFLKQGVERYAPFPASNDSNSDAQ